MKPERGAMTAAARADPFPHPSEAMAEAALATALAGMPRADVAYLGWPAAGSVNDDFYAYAEDHAAEGEAPRRPVPAG